MSRVPSSRATMAAGTSPPRVMQTMASNGPSPARRQASARASRWNWSHETGNAFCWGDAMRTLRAKKRSDGNALGLERGDEIAHRARGSIDGAAILAAHDDLVGEAAGAEGRIGADRDLRMRLGDLAQAGRVESFRHAAGADGLDDHARAGLERRRHVVEHGLHDRWHAGHDDDV